MAAKSSLPQEIEDKIISAPDRPVARPLEERHFHQRELKQNEWFVYAFHTVTLNDVLERSYWGSVAPKLRRGDKVCVMSEDGRLYVELIVFAVGNNWAEVRVFGEPIVVSRSVMDSSYATDFVVKDLGLIKGWGVVEVATGREVKNDGSLKTEDAARAWLRDYLTTGARRVA